MSGNSPSLHPPHNRRPRSLRWIVVLLASILLHVVALDGVNGYLTLPAWRTEQPEVIVTQLRPAPAVKKEMPKQAAATPERKPKPRKPAPPPPAPESTAALPAAGVEAPGTSVEPAVEVTSAEPAPPQINEAPAAAEASAAPGHKLSPPPPAELKYDVEAKRDGKQWYGKGMFRWESSGNAYRITGEASVTILFKITVLNFKSEGVLNGFGIAPVLYSEQPWRKAMTNTHFQHENRKITFSASQAAYPYRGGEQDRASIMWQLASIGRGDASQFSPGAAFDIVVAGAREADTWRIEVVGLEEISTPYSKMAVWHLVRTPRPGSYDQKLDIWLAPTHEWYPARLRFTYANGDYLDMALAAMTVQAPAAISDKKE